MKSKDRTTGTLELQANTVPSHRDRISTHSTPNHDEIKRRAYEIYLERGGLPGQELEDWFQAEREIESAAHFMRATIGEKHKP